MGWNPFKNLKKIVKSVGKHIRKVGRGLKKIMAKIAKPFAKLGPLGSIALSMFIPWAAGAIFQGLTGTALTLGSFGASATANIASKSLFKKALGYVMKGVHWGATKVSNAYQFVSDKISTGMDALTGKAKEVFGVNADAGDLIADAVQNGPEIDVSILDKNLAEQAREATLSPNATLGKTLDVSEAVVSEASGKVAEKAVEKSFFTKAKDKVKETVITSLATNVETALTPQEEATEYEGVAFEPYNFLADNASYTKFNEASSMLSNQGHNYGGPAYQANIDGSDFGQDTFYQWFNQYSPTEAPRAI